ncbi:MAG: hypothetical protein H3C26_15465 [Rhodocyclaceae bacterium]|nr:hypothetical protein [Rhodocyclaceae bacterium]
MIFQPAIIALLLASALSVAMLAAAAPFALQLIRRWDIACGSELQLRLERRTYLFSTLTALVFVVQIVALLLTVFNADRMAAMFVGAMCAVGTLNANAWGFPMLHAQIVLFFLAAIWLVLNHVDNQARDYPLVRVKYAFLLFLLPVVAVVAALQLRYFLDLRADVITSCCGSLFSEGSRTLTSEISGMEARPALLLFYAALGAAVFANALHAGLERRWSGVLAGLASAAAFAAAMTGILSFVSLYVYEHPHHHCPFCLVKPEYGYQGYLLYLPLFAATAAGLGAGVLQFFVRRPGLVVPGVRAATRLAGFAACGFALFSAIATAMVARSNLVLLG